MKAYILYINRENSIKYMEECIKTCEKYGIEPIPVENYCDLSSEELSRLTGLRMGSYNPAWSNEYACTVGHIVIWSLISKHETNEPVLVFEHDELVVSEKILDITVEDGQILFLGPKVFDRNDYTFPPGEEIKNVDVNRFHGTHGYAVTPNTVRFLLSRIHEEGDLLPTPIDGMLGINNHYSLKISVVDPPVGIVEIGHRQSFTGESGLKVAIMPTEMFDAVFYNAQHLDGFKRGLKKIKKKGYQFSNLERYEPIINDMTVCLEKAEIDKNQLNTALIIGANEGKLTTWLIDNYLLHNESTVWSIDTLKGSVEHQSSPREMELLRDKYFYNILSSSAPKKTVTFEGTGVQITEYIASRNKTFNIFIFDEIKNEEMIVNICQDLFKLIEKDGIIMFYDWHSDNSFPVRRAIARLKSAFNVKDISNGCVLALKKR